MSVDIDQFILENEDKLKDYVYVTLDEIDTIPPGSYIRFINRENKLSGGGFLTFVVKGERDEQTKIILRSIVGRKIQIRPYFFPIFYKQSKEKPKKENKKTKAFKNILESLE